MMDFISSKIIPRLDALEAQNRKLELRFNTVPKIDIDIESTDIEKLVDAVKMLYNNFGVTCQLNIKANLKEAAADGVQP